jgi:hypothetical protein
VEEEEKRRRKMTQRERIDDTGAEVYETPATTRTTTARTTRPIMTNNAPNYDIDVVNPTDSIRWGPVIAGLFAALATLAALTVLGLAIGASAFDPNDQLSSFGIGASIWGAISALIAFFIGGWLAGRTAGVPGRNSGILNGAMVWFVAIPLLLYGLGSGISAIGRTVGNVAATTAQVAAPVAGEAAQEAANDPAVAASAQAGAAGIAATAQAGAEAVQNQLANPNTQQSIADSISTNAWRTLLSLGLAAAAAIGGGYVGGRNKAERRAYLG